MKKSTIALVAIAAVLGSAVAYYLASGTSNSSIASDTAWERDFSVKNTDDIYKIFLADRRGQTTTLTRKGDRWIYNDQFPANPNIVKNLLQVIRLVDIKYIPPRSAIQPMVENLSTQGIKVEIYDQGDRLMKSYYVGGTTPDELGTYMIMENSEMPYVTSIASMQGGVRVRYDIFGDKWRDKVLFDVNPEKVEAISIDFPKQRNKSFKLNIDGGKAAVVPYYEISPSLPGDPLDGAVDRYLESYDRVSAEAFENNNKEKERIITEPAFCHITVKEQGQEEVRVTLIPTFDTFVDGKKKSEVIQRYYAMVEPAGDLMLVQHQVIKGILRPYNYFFGKE
ncbi:MAG: DUF4340 domain-containing protein [Bacteroidota bacterium]